MPTTQTIVVDTGGSGDYSTLRACAEDLVGTDLTSVDKIYHVICKATTNLEDAGGYAYFRTITSDATRYLIVETHPNYRTWLYPYTRGYRLHVTTDAALLIQTDYARVRNMAVHQQSTAGGYPSGVWFNADECQLENTVIVSTGNGVETYSLSLNAAGVKTFRARNVHAISMSSGFPHGFRGLNAGAAQKYYFNNCSFFTSRYLGFQITGTGYTLVAKNCMFHGAPTVGADLDPTVVFSTGTTNNAFFHGTTPASGTNWKDYSRFGQATRATAPGVDQNKLFVDEAGDFRLRDRAVGPDGTDLSADANFPVTTDITGAARGRSWYLGAFAPLTQEQAPMNARKRRVRRLRLSRKR